MHFTEGEHQVIETTVESNFMPLAADIKPHVKGASLIALCSPLNPTGTIFKREELKAICDLVLEENGSRLPEEKKLYVMYDQMYGELMFGNSIHYNPVTLRPAMKDYTIFIDGISKTFAATGVRVGWVLGPQYVLSKMKAINSHVGAWSPMTEQHATAKYLLNKAAVNKYLVHFKNELELRLVQIYEGFKKLKSEGFCVDAVTPQAAIYLTVQFNLAGKKTPGGLLLAKQNDVTDYILNNAGLAVVPFYAFGTFENSSWYRLSVGTCKKKEIKDMLEKLKEALKRLI